jgi:hypothetical protein
MYQKLMHAIEVRIKKMNLITMEMTMEVGGGGGGG